jgi:hypothetical protein
MDEMNMEMEMNTDEVLDTEVVEDDTEYDVVETDGGDHGMLKTAAKAVIGLGVAVGGIFGITKVVKKRQMKYIENTPKGLIRCK